MSDGEVEKEKLAVHVETNVRSLAIHGTSLRDRLKTSLAKERYKELKKERVSSRDGVTTKLAACEEVIGREGGPTTTGGRRREVWEEAEAEAGGEPEIVIG